MTTTWTTDQLGRIGAADELEVASRRADGSLRSFVTIWVVRSGDAIYIRSAHGPENPWFRRALASGTGRIRAGGVERDVTFAVPAADVRAALDAAYRSKYASYPVEYVNPVADDLAATATLVITPA
ncbi:DUF2255 family protein [Parafrigoribacterium humi]|uniref:DUF2255 family protein n=1 Tax=Parafrigoribacterium humi TaxID=3144664 RepID=UPI0032EFACEB